MASISMEAFREQEALKYITGRQHPDHDLIIWNYTPQCQFGRSWNKITMQARGLITKSDGTIVARPFKKFFNLEEHIGQGLSLPLEPFKVTEKMDGSLGILFFADGKPYIATRGSFTSEQAMRANQILQEKYSSFLSHLSPAFTYLFEIIYPQNRIVVDYGDTEDLILLAAIKTETGEELNIHNPLWVDAWPFPIVKYHDGIEDIAVIKTLEEPNKEGFVIRFESGLRLKVKFDDYKRLHRILTQCTARTIWECLKANLSFDAFLDRVPDEFYVWSNAIKNDLQAQYTQIENECRTIAEQVKTLSTRKEQAAIIVQKSYPGVIFQMLDQKDWQEAIWKLLRPTAERPFREDEEV